MNQSEFEKIYQLENSHWWYVGMREIWEMVLAKFVRKTNFAKILDIGCGTGGNLSVLNKFGLASGVEYDSFAVNLCLKNGFKCTKGSALELPKKDTYDLITFFDVLYQFEASEIQKILSDAKQILNKKGVLLIREPALEIAKGRHDLLVKTKTRFNQSDLNILLTDLGFKIEFMSYINFLLFVPIVLNRKIELLTDPTPKSDVSLPSKIVNFFFLTILRIESKILLIL